MHTNACDHQGAAGDALSKRRSANRCLIWVDHAGGEALATHAPEQECVLAELACFLPEACVDNLTELGEQLVLLLQAAVSCQLPYRAQHQPCTAGLTSQLINPLLTHQACQQVLCAFPARTRAELHGCCMIIAYGGNCGI